MSYLFFFVVLWIRWFWYFWRVSIINEIEKTNTTAIFFPKIKCNKNWQKLIKKIITIQKYSIHTTTDPNKIAIHTFLFKLSKSAHNAKKWSSISYMLFIIYNNYNSNMQLWCPVQIHQWTLVQTDEDKIWRDMHFDMNLENLVLGTCILMNGMVAMFLFSLFLLAAPPPLPAISLFLVLSP